MEWSDDAIILATRRHGESSLIAEVLTREHGRHLGLVRGGKSLRQAAVLQPSNTVRLTWRARLDAHLGQFTVEPVSLRAGHLMGSALALHGLAHLADLVRLLAEREPHGALFEALEVVCQHLDEAALAGPLIARFELALLGELGFGLDLSACAVTGSTQELAFVSPRSGRAVSRPAAGPWADRLLPLPRFLAAHVPGDEVGAGEIHAAFRLTGFFLSRHVWEARGLPPPDARSQLLAALAAR